MVLPLQRIDSEVPSSQRGDLLIFVAGLADITTLSAALKVGRGQWTCMILRLSRIVTPTAIDVVEASANFLSPLCP
jgi:hypothetical protein